MKAKSTATFSVARIVAKTTSQEVMAYLIHSNGNTMAHKKGRGEDMLKGNQQYDFAVIPFTVGWMTRLTYD